MCVRSIDFGEMAEAYSRGRKVNPEVLRNLVSLGGLTAGSRVLEVGCGTGNYIGAARALTGASCWGVDPSEGMLAIARQRVQGVSLAAGRAERLAFSDASFDLVFSVDVIHHVGAPEEYFREARRVLRPGGKVCTVTDSDWVIRHRRPLADYFPETVDVDLARYPRMDDLRQLMARVGFEQVREDLVEHRYELTHAQTYREKAFSCLRLISEQAFARGLRRMKQDLSLGPIEAVSPYVCLWGIKG